MPVGHPRPVLQVKTQAASVLHVQQQRQTQADSSGSICVLWGGSCIEAHASALMATLLTMMHASWQPYQAHSSDSSCSACLW